MVIVLQMQDQPIIETIEIIADLHILHLLILPEVRGTQHPQTPILLHVRLIQHLKIPIATLHTPDLPTLHLIVLHIPDQVVRQADLLILLRVPVAVPHLHLPEVAAPQEEEDNFTTNY